MRGFGKKKKVAKPPISLRDAPEAEQIATLLKEKYHTHLLGVRVDCCFRSETQKNKGKLVLGSAAKTTVREEFLGRKGRNSAGQFTAPEHYFVIVLSEPEWKLLNDDQRIALVDHELAHCGVAEKDDGTRILKLLPHDIEEFAAVVDRNGLWKRDLEQFARAARPHMQGSLDLVDGGESGRCTITDSVTGATADMSDQEAAQRVAEKVIRRAVGRTAA